MGGKWWYGGNISAQMTSRGLLFKNQKVGWSFKAFLMFHFGIVTSLGLFHLHNWFSFQHITAPNPGRSCWCVLLSSQGPQRESAEEYQLDLVPSTWISRSSLIPMELLMFQYICPSQAFIMVPDTLSAHVSIKQNAFAAVSLFMTACQDFCSSMWARKSWKPFIPSSIDTSR